MLSVHFFDAIGKAVEKAGYKLGEGIFYALDSG